MTRVKKYRADDMPAALNMIRAELGPHAVIVQSQKVRPGWLGLFRKPQVEVVAAGDSGPAARNGQLPRGKGQKPPSLSGTPLTAQLERGPAVSSAPQRPGPSPQLPAGGRAVHTAAAAIAAARQRTPPAGGPESQSQGPQPLNGLVHDMQSTVGQLRTTLQRLLQPEQDSSLPREGPAMRAVYRHLLAREVDPSLALDLLGTLSSALTVAQAQQVEIVLGQAKSLLAARFPVRGHLLSAASVAGASGANGRAGASNTRGPRAVFLVGPTGVGKTTTLAKLAARLALAEGQKVALLTCDTFRIAAASQLATYAEIMALPLEVAYSPDQLAEAAQRYAHVDYLLIDTPGFGQRSHQIEELASFVTALPAAPLEEGASVGWRGTWRGREAHLVVAAPTKYADLLDVVESFRRIPLDALLITKLDETKLHGPVLSLVAGAGLPVSYVTMGQNVPQDIEVAQADRLAMLAL